jgi:UDP-N-acetyl-2-amino-2-deoxyglucuronate dehydrogenase
MSEPFRFVIVGSGGISKAYIQSIRNLKNVALAGLISRSGRRPEGLPDDTPVFASLGDVTVAFDAVILATPNGLHHVGAAEAAALGKHVLVEKVLDVTRENMDQIEKVCADAGVTLGVTYQRRMSPDNIALKKLLDDGALGRLFAAEMDVKYYRDQAYYDSGAYRGGWAIDGGGPFIQQAAHNADLLCWFFGMPEKVVSMCDRFDHDIAVDDHGVALLRYSNGLIVTFTASTVCKPGYPTHFELFTEKGSVIVHNDQIATWNIDGVDNPADLSFEVHDGATSATVADTAGHEAIIADFAAAARDGREPMIPAASGRLATELVLAIYGGNVLA